MRGRLLLLALLSMTGAAGLYAAGILKLPQLPWNIASVSPATAPKIEIQTQGKSEQRSIIDETTAALGLDAQGNQPKPATEPVLDISRVSRDGVSVFAGRAAPNSYVTVLEDGKPAGTAHADENGSWSLSTEHRFTSLDPKLTFRSDTKPPAPAAPKAPATVASISPATPPKSASPTQEVMQRFEGLVAEAREHAKAAPEAKPSPDVATSETATSDASSSAGQANKPDKSIEVGAAATSTPAQSQPAPIPVPIMFVYNEAALTPEGHRAVSLLLEYVKLEQLPAIALSGHADERGTDDYNMDLSRERLETVARILRDGGYAGDLKLKPMGKSEPYTGIDRSKYAKEALYQLDRRVELHIVR